MHKNLYQIIEIDGDGNNFENKLTLNERASAYFTDGLEAYDAFGFRENQLSLDDSSNSTVWLKKIDVDDSFITKNWDVTYFGAAFYYPEHGIGLYRHKCEFSDIYKIADSVVSNRVGHIGEQNRVYALGDQFMGTAIVTTSYDEVCDWLDKRHRESSNYGRGRETFDKEYVKELIGDIKEAIRGDRSSDVITKSGDLLGIVHHTIQYANSKEEFSKAFDKVREVFNKVHQQQRASLREEGMKCARASEQMHEDKSCDHRCKSPERDM